MKILHIIYSLRNGGAERILIDLVKGLNVRGHENQICTIIPKNFFKPELDHFNISYNNLLNKEKIRFITYLPLIMLKLKNQIKIFKPDIMHEGLWKDLGTTEDYIDITDKLEEIKIEHPEISVLT